MCCDPVLTAMGHHVQEYTDAPGLGGMMSCWFRSLGSTISMPFCPWWVLLGVYSDSKG